MKLSVINKLYKGQMLLKCAPQYVHPTGTTPTPKLGYPSQSGLGEKGVFLVKWVVVCLVGAHTVPRSGGWKGRI